MPKTLTSQLEKQLRDIEKEDITRIDKHKESQISYAESRKKEVGYVHNLIKENVDELVRLFDSNYNPGVTESIDMGSTLFGLTTGQVIKPLTEFKIIPQYREERPDIFMEELGYSESKKFYHGIRFLHLTDKGSKVRKDLATIYGISPRKVERSEEFEAAKLMTEREKEYVIQELKKNTKYIHSALNNSPFDLMHTRDKEGLKEFLTLRTFMLIESLRKYKRGRNYDEVDGSEEHTLEILGLVAHTEGREEIDLRLTGRGLDMYNGLLKVKGKDPINAKTLDVNYSEVDENLKVLYVSARESDIHQWKANNQPLTCPLENLF